mgnify:CR=1 FL=1
MNYREELKNNMVEYDLNDPAKKEMIEAFEKELGDKNFNKYCVELGYFTKRETELEDGNLLTEYLFVPEKIKELAIVYSKAQALKLLKK